jgi:serine/threonine-protein kinase RsbT
MSADVRSQARLVAHLGQHLTRLREAWAHRITSARFLQALRPVEEGAISTSIASAGDIVLARRRGRDLALALGFSSTDSTLVATAISELARNMVLYASSGTVRVETARDGGRTGLAIVASDDGPGIAHVQRAMIGGYSTSGGLGLGLSGVKRIMDEVHVRSQTGAGTTVVAKKWLRQ